jgi:hypothetical protein
MFNDALLTAQAIALMKHIAFNQPYHLSFSCLQMSPLMWSLRLAAVYLLFHMLSSVRMLLARLSAIVLILSI